MTTPSRGSRAGRDRIAREQATLVRLARFRKLTSAHIEGFTFDGTAVLSGSRASMTRKILGGLRRRRLIDLAARQVGGPSAGSSRPAYQLTELGRRYLARLEPGFAAASPRESASIEHALAAADVALAFVRSARACLGHAMSEWEPDRSAAEILGSSRVVPDAYFVYETRSWEIGAFVEIDLGTERPVRFGRKVAEYVVALRRGEWRAHLPSWPIVLVVTPDAARATLLRRVTETVIQRERDGTHLADVMEFDFAALGDVGGPQGPLGAIWQVAGREGLHPLLPSEGSLDARARSESFGR